MALLFLLFFGLPALYGWCFHIIYLYGYRLAIPKEAVFFPATWFTFIIPGFLLMLMTLGHLIVAIQKLYLDVRYPAFEAYYNREQGYDNNAASRWVAKIMLIPMLIMLIAASVQYVVVDPGGFTYKDMFQLKASRFSFTDISGLDFMKSLPSEQKGMIVNDTYRVRMAGKDTIRKDPYFDNYEDMLPFVRAIQLRTGFVVDTIPLTH